MNFKKVVVLAPHPDDTEFGCGGFVNKLVKSGAEVEIIVFSDCAKSLPENLTAADLINEQKAAAKSLGIREENIHFKDYSVREFPAHRQMILEDLVQIKRTTNPDLVLCPSSDDLHQDHQTIGSEAVRAFKATTILGYELPWNHLESQLNYHVKLEESNVEAKLKAISCYKSQSFRPYFDKDLFRSLARVRGAQIQTQYAEAFELIRAVHA